MQSKVLITDNAHELLQAGLEKAGYVCDYRPNISMEETLACIHLYKGLIINSKILVFEPLLAKAERLEWVGRLGSGLEIIDLPAAQKHGVSIFSSPEGNCDAVGEHALGLLLGLATKLSIADAAIRQNHTFENWDREAYRGWELGGKTLAIIGFGHTGRAFAERLRGLNMRILAYDKYKTNYTNGCEWVEETSLEKIYAETDILSLHLPLTPETEDWLNAERLQQFAKKLVLINTARGQLFSVGTLLENLQNQKIVAAGLDVLPNEKPATYSILEKMQAQTLWKMPNVLLTPHVAGWTQESKKRLASILLEKILKKFPKG